MSSAMPPSHRVARRESVEVDEAVVRAVEHPRAGARDEHGVLHAHAHGPELVVRYLDPKHLAQLEPCSGAGGERRRLARLETDPMADMLLLVVRETIRADSFHGSVEHAA